MTQPSRRAWRSPAARRCGILIVYAVLAIWSTWPVARAPLTTLPIGSMHVATVPLFNLWTIWWNADRLAHNFKGYWEAPIFHPNADTFAFSEPQPATVVLAPIIWISGSRVLACNVYLWVSLFLNAVFAERLLRLIGTSHRVAVGGAIGMLLLPLVHWQLDVLQLTPLWGILWTWAALLKASRQPSAWHGAAVGAAFAMTFWMCAHQALLLAVLLCGTVWILPRCWRAPALWIAGLAAIVVATPLVLPFVVHMRHVIATHNFVRSADMVNGLSALPGDYSSVPGKLLFPFGEFGARPSWMLSPGWIKWGLAAVGIAFGLARRKWRRWTIYLLVTATFGFLLSLGTNLKVSSWEPWWMLSKHWPGLSQVRNVFRFAFFVQMTAVVLAAQAIHGMLLMNRRFCTARRMRNLAAAVIWLLGIAALAETRPQSPNIAGVPNAAANSAWMDFVRRETPAGQGIACFPFSTGNMVEDYEVTARWMYLGTFHRVPLVDGYSGFFPAEHFTLRDAVNMSLLTEPTLEKLIDAKAEFLVVRSSEFAVPMPREAWFGAVWITHVFEDPAGVDVYRLGKSPGTAN
jgi:hypothetical protein